MLEYGTRGVSRYYNLIYIDIPTNSTNQIITNVAPIINCHSRSLESPASFVEVGSA